MVSPPIAVFLPVHNGMPFLPQCVTSLLNQTYSNFKIIILENGSTDGTADFLAKLKDPRILIAGSSEKLPIETNWSKISLLCDTDFMTVVGHDDILEENFIEEMLNLTNLYPQSALFSSHFYLLNQDTGKTVPCKEIPLIENQIEFLERRLLFERDSFGTGHLFRSAHFKNAGGFLPFPNLLYADDFLWTSLLGISTKVTSAQYLFTVRIHKRSTSASSGITTHISALDHYAKELSKLANTHPKLKSILKEKWGTYVLCILWHHFTQAIQKNRWPKSLPLPLLKGLPPMLSYFNQSLIRIFYESILFAIKRLFKNAPKM